MSITSIGSFAATNNKIAATTLTFTSSRDIGGGQLGVLFVGADNLTTTVNSNDVLRVVDNGISYNFNQGTGFNNTARTIVTQSDGKILVGGDFSTYNGQKVNRIVRLNTDGTLDSSFIPTGFVDNTVFKLAIQPNITGSYYSSSGVWTTGGSLITSRNFFGGAGTQNEALAFGGQTALTCTEEYNGTSWAASPGALITGRDRLAGVGTQNATLAFGGNTPGTFYERLTEEYDGTSWAAGGLLIVGRSTLAGAGTQNVGLAISGICLQAGAPVPSNNTEEYNGTSWSTANTLNTARCGFLSSAGTQNAALAFGGITTPSATAGTEEYDGTSWSVTADLINARQGGGGTGLQTAALAFGGGTPVPPFILSATEQYNGISWSAQTNLINTKQNDVAGAGTQKQALAISGISEEFNISVGGTCISDKIIAVGTMTGRAIRLNPDGSEDPSFNTGTGFDSTVCTVIVQETGSYTPTTPPVTIDAWSAGGALITNRVGLAGAGTQNAGLVFGGFAGSPILARVACTEEYSGTSWSAGGNLITDRDSLAGFGIQNAALAVGGFSGSVDQVSCTEEYDGTSWASGGALIIPRLYLAGAGTQNEGLAFGGVQVGFDSLSCTEEYNGTSWSSGNVLIVPRYGLAGAGTQNAALAIAGYDSLSGEVASAEEYNGTSWTTGGNMIVVRTSLAAAGTQNEALAFGGCCFNFLGDVIYSCTEKYNGSTWSTTGALITARYYSAGAGTQNQGLAAGGQDSSNAEISCTEEYFGTVNETTTVNAWTVGGSMITSRIGAAGAGTQNSALASGGSTIGGSSNICTEEYNGISWTATVSLITPRVYLAGAGTQNSGLAFGDNGLTAVTEEYNGTTWSAGGNMITARGFLAGAGTQNQALAFGGSTGTPSTSTEEYNGTSWAAGGALITARSTLGGAGTQNAALAFGGSTTAPIVVGCTEEYNGSTWVTSATLITAREELAGAGTQNAALAIAGFETVGPVFTLTCTEKYNGTSWSVGGATINSRCSPAAAGTQNSGLVFSGRLGSTNNESTCTEEYIGTLTFNDTSSSYSNKLIFGGEFGSYNGEIFYPGIIRLNADGTIDSSFNIGGGFSPSDVRTLQFYSSSTCIIAGGAFTNYSGSDSGSVRNRIALLNATDGTLIPTSSFNIGAGFNQAVNSVAVQPDNKILAVGNFTAYSGSGVNRIARINTTGLIDTGSTFNSGAGLNNTGSVVQFYTSASVNVILVGGTFTTYSGSAYSGSVRILASGSRDTNFFTGVGSAVDVEDYLVEDDVDNGIIIVGGFTAYTGSTSFPSPNRIVKVFPNGRIDASITGSTWTKRSERGTGDAAGAGSTVAMFTLIPTSKLYQGTTLTTTFNASITAKAASGWVFDGNQIIALTGSVSSSAAGGTSDPPAMRFTNLTSGSGEYLYIRGISYENDNLTFTPTTNFTPITATSTAGGSAITNQGIVGEFRIITTGSLVSDPSLSTATSNANIYFVFYETVVIGGKTYFILLD